MSGNGRATQVNTLYYLLRYAVQRMSRPRNTLLVASLGAMMRGGCASTNLVTDAQNATGAAALARLRSSPLRVVLLSRFRGGGYRAMLFHVGGLWRLHELGLLLQQRGSCQSAYCRDHDLPFSAKQRSMVRRYVGWWR